MHKIIYVHYLHYRFSVSCNSNAHNSYSCFLQYREIYSDKEYFNPLIHVVSPIIGIAPATVYNTATPTTTTTAVNTATPTTPTTAVNTATPTTPTTAVNITTPSGPQPSSTDNILV